VFVTFQDLNHFVDFHETSYGHCVSEGLLSQHSGKAYGERHSL
jgi:hypothetical protein